MSQITLDQLSPEALAAIVAQVQANQAQSPTGRSPVMGPSKNLLSRPSATNPVPMFTFPTDGLPAPPPYVRRPYPSLRFKAEGDKVIEMVVHTVEQDAALGEEWLQSPPNMAPLTSEEMVRQEMAALSDEDRAFVLDQQRQARLNRVSAALNGLSDGQVASVLGPAVKRGPGRPKKATDGHGA